MGAHLFSAFREEEPDRDAFAHALSVQEPALQCTTHEFDRAPPEFSLACTSVPTGLESEWSVLLEQMDEVGAAEETMVDFTIVREGCSWSHSVTVLAEPEVRR